MAGSSVTLALVGDLYVQRPEPEPIFAHAAPDLREADIAFGNLEMPLTNLGAPVEGKVLGTRRSEERMIAAYTYAGFDVVGLANNHIMDYGAEGLLRTIELLDQAHIAHTGGGRNLEEARKPAILERNGTRVAFLSYSSVYEPIFAATPHRPGIATVRVTTAYEPSPRVFEQPGSPAIIRTLADPKDAAAMAENVRRAKEAADVVVVSWHWGVSQGFRHMVEYQVAMGHAAIGAGADLVIGHHPHVLQAVEVYQGKAIFYSIAQFGFDMDTPHFSHETMLVRCRIRDRALQEVSFLPARINDQLQPVVLDTTLGQDIVEQVRALSASFGTAFQVQADEVVVQTPVAAKV